MGNLNVVVILAVLLTKLHAFPPGVPLKPSQQRVLDGSQSTGSGPPEDRGAAEEEREQIKSVTVSCHPDSLEIVVQADLFGVGASVRSSDVRLGVDNNENCRAIPSSREEYKIIAGLLDCGTKHWMTQDSLVYTNLLIYSPEPPSGGVVRMEEAVIPVECHYDRKYSLSSPAFSPTWIPFVSTMTAAEKLNFDLTIMTPDWQYKRNSNMFYLGDDINIMASVRLGHHVGLRVFLSSCVATLGPDEQSSPRYVFIEDGCLLDSKLPNSKSQFLPRAQDHKLHLVLDAFRFSNEDRAELYVTCRMTAVPVHDAEAPNKACTYINGRWRSADGNDYLCGYCQAQNEENNIKDKQSGQFRPRGLGGPEIPERPWRSGLKTEQDLNMKAKVGPVLVLTTEEKTDPNADMPLYGSAWRSGFHQKSGFDDHVIDSLIENGDSEDNADNVFVPDESPSPEEIPENMTETEEFSSNMTDHDHVGNSDEDETSEDAADEFDESREELVPQVFEVQENETTLDPSDIHTVSHSPVYNITGTTSMNNTEPPLSDTNEPKRK